MATTETKKIATRKTKAVSSKSAQDKVRPSSTLLSQLQEQFGFDSFKDSQDAIIQSLLSGKDTFVIMPTGGGKSLCYQLPALLLPGVTLVVSPLIALMKDQVDALAARGLCATLINSTLDPSEQASRLAEIERGRFPLVYVAPERFRSEAFMNSIAETKVRMFAVDEAHCISHWGHDFRPDYLRMKPAIEQLGNPQVIALTATATPVGKLTASTSVGPIA